jgi:hypothetical protein
MTRLYSLTSFLSAWLLFGIQPMIARALLPDLGGAPIVWNVCVVFFQLLLLCGYAYAHWTSRHMTAARQRGLHLALFALPLGLFAAAVFLHGAPIAIWPAARAWLAPDAQPILGMLGALTASVAAPCVILSATSPLLQRWYAQSGAQGADDPYFLYAASNLGSLAALVAYPLFVERYLSRAVQWWTWAGGFLVFAAMTSACAIAAARSGAGEASGASWPLPSLSYDRRSGSGATPRSYWRRLRWLALSAVPASLLLGVTGYITTDIAAVPLLWVIPLVLYLLSFVIAFARRPIIAHRVVMRYLPLALIVWSVTIVLGATEPASVLLAVHLAAFFWAALACHGELHRDRPAASDLTGYYLIVSFGGVFGGAANTFLAPAMFESYFEYPLAMLAAFLMAASPVPADATTRDASERAKQKTPLSLAIDIGVPVVAVLLVVIGASYLEAAGHSAEKALTDPAARYVRGTAYAVPLVWCLLWSARTVPFALGVAAVLCVVPMTSAVYGGVLHVERTLFGVHRVTVDAAGEFHLLIHGTTVHGRQRWSPEPAADPGSYYHADGPVGDLFRLIGAKPEARRIAVVGLGAGSLACYGRDRPEQHWTFYEIDPAVVRIARDTRYFTFLSDSFADSSRLAIIVGDARLQLAKAADGQFDLVILDAFSSDSVPVHLVTKEALALYLRKLARGGLVALHVSNRHLELRPLVAALAAAQDEPLVARARDDTITNLSPEEQRAGKQASVWVLLARDAADVAALPESWQPLAADPSVAAWTDEYASILAVAKDSFWPVK